MSRFVPLFTRLFITATLVAAVAPADAQPNRRPRPNDREQVARAQRVPPGQLPPPSQCRVWYDERPAGRQPAPTACDRAEAAAARDARARVVYGEDRYQVESSPSDERDASPAFRNGYRDGLAKGREDFEQGNQPQVGRHPWYRLATRGYESRHGTRYEYIDRYRRGFESGYDRGYRTYGRR